MAEDSLLTKWIGSGDVPSVIIGQQRFYVEAAMKDGQPDVATSHIYSPISASEDRVFVRELTRDSLKKIILTQYLREFRATKSIPFWTGAR